MLPANAEKFQGRFQKGQSGNPAGKPKGTRHRATVLLEALMQDGAEAVVSTVMNAAKNGDMQAAKIILDRLIPARKDAPISIDLPSINTANDAAAAMSGILSATCHGEITPAEADTVAKLIGGFSRQLELANFEERLQALEQKSLKS